MSWPKAAVCSVPVLELPSFKTRLPCCELVPTVVVAPWTVIVPEKVGLLTMVIALHVPPEPSVMLVPPPLKLPVPDGQVNVTLPCTAVFAPEP